MKLSKLASAMPFAHYLGLGLGASAARTEENDDERKQRDKESDEDYAKRMDDLDDDEAARKAEEEKKKEDARKAEEKEKDEAAKRAKQAEGGDEDEMKDEEDDEESGKRAGRAKGARQRERVRCAAILAEGLRMGNIKQACAFACDTDMSAVQAIAVLKAGTPEVAARSSGLRDRMAVVQVPNPGSNSGPAAGAPSSKSMADRIVAAGERARNKQ